MDTQLFDERSPLLYDAGGLPESQISRLPESLDASYFSGVMGLFRRATEELALEEIAKHTGLESLSNSELLTNMREKGAFVNIVPTGKDLDHKQNFLPPLLLSGLNNVADRYAPISTRLEELLASKPLLELGASMNFSHHRLVFEHFGITAFDTFAYDVTTNLSDKNEKFLTFLTNLPNSSTNVAAFGLFDELFSLDADSNYRVSDFLWPAGTPESASARQYSHEYMRRVAKELYRITAQDGLLFGAGIHPGPWQHGDEQYFNAYLLAAGFQVDKPSQRMIHALADSDEERFEYARYRPYLDSFFLRKVS